MGDDERCDDDLLARARLEPALLSVLYERHAEAVYRYLARRAGTQVAEDLLSDVFVAALDARMRVVPHSSGSALPWLYGISRNVLRAHFRRLDRAQPRSYDLAMDWDQVDDRLDAVAQRRRLKAVLSTLSRADRELLLLVAWEGLSPAEAASSLGITKVTARSRLHRARQRAQLALAEASPVTAPTTTLRSIPVPIQENPT